MSEIPAVPLQAVLHRIEVAQRPSLKDLPQFPRFLHNVKTLRKVVDTNYHQKLQDSPIESQWEAYMRADWARIISDPHFDGDIEKAKKEHDQRMEQQGNVFFSSEQSRYKKNTERQLLLHDVNTNATVLMGFKILRGNENKQPPDWYVEYEKRMSAVASGTNRETSSIKDTLEQYNELARFIRRHESVIDTTTGQSAFAQEHFKNAFNTAHLWPMIHASSNMMDAIYRQDFAQIDKWYSALATMRVPIERLVASLGTEAIKNGTVTYPKGEIDGLRAMTIFNLIHDAKSTGIKKCNLRIHNGEISLDFQADRLPDKDRLFRPSETKNKRHLSGDGLYVVKQFHSVLAGNDIRYYEQLDAKPLKEYSFTLFPSLDSTQAQLQLPGVNTERLRANLLKLQVAMTEAARKGAYDGWQGRVAKAKEAVAYANFEVEQAAKRGECPPMDILPNSPPKPQPPYDTSGSWQKFVMHDINGVLTMPQIVASALGATSHESEDAKILARSSEKMSKGYNIARPLPNRIQAADEFMADMSAHFEAAIAKEGDKVSQFKEYFEKSKRSVWIWNMISASTHLLEGIHTQNASEISRWFSKLQNTRVMVADIVHITNKGIKKVECTPPELLGTMTDGVRGIMLFNLLKNAHVHAQSEIRITQKDGVLTVENDVKEPVEPSTFFQPMKPGQSGNTGFGLFTLKHVYGELSGLQIEPETTQTSVAFRIH